MDRSFYEGRDLSLAHQTILGIIEPGSSVLDVGCGGGLLARVLRENAGCTVTGVEYDPERAVHAEPWVHKLVVGDISTPSVWDQIGECFDFVVFADVLEHLIDPGGVLLRCREVLSTKGRVVASIPNVAYYRIRKDLLLGRFEYQPWGILDKTHLRFFTAKTARALFADAGYDVEEFVRVFSNRKNELLGKLSPNAFAYQFVIKASPAEPA